MLRVKHSDLSFACMCITKRCHYKTQVQMRQVFEPSQWPQRVSPSSWTTSSVWEQRAVSWTVGPLLSVPTTVDIVRTPASSVDVSTQFVRASMWAKWAYMCSHLKCVTNCLYHSSEMLCEIFKKLFVILFLKAVYTHPTLLYKKLFTEALKQETFSPSNASHYISTVFNPCDLSLSCFIVCRVFLLQLCHVSTETYV